MGNPSGSDNQFLMRLAKEVRSFREAAGLSQQELAERAKTSRSVVARLEAGVRPPTLNTLTAISTALGVDMVLSLQQPQKAPITNQPSEGFRAIKVLVADAQRLFAECLATALAQFPDLEVSYVQPQTSLATALEAAEAVIRKKPDIALLDYWLTEMKGEALIRTVLGWRPETKVLILSWFHGPRDIEAAMGAGAAGFLPKTLPVEEVAETIRSVQAGHTLEHTQRVQQLVQTIAGHDEESKHLWDRLIRLTPREIDVLRMLASGQPMKQIAKAISISQGTLRIHLNNIMSKTGAESRMEAVAMARRAGLIE